MKRRRTVFLALGLIFLALFYFWSQWQRSKIPQKTSVSVYGATPLGIQLFYQLAQKLHQGPVQVDRKSMWEDRVPPDAILFILSPKKPISAREVSLLTSFVERGGRLVLSFETEQAWLYLQPLLSAIKGPSAMEKDKSFKNGVVSVQSPSQNFPWWQAKEKYAFYSRYWISGPDCSHRDFSCYVREWGYQKGDALLMAGLPIFSNALLKREDNRRFAFRLIAEDAPLWFDEYHHFYSDHTFAQLLKQPSFGLPLLGMMACVLLFFLFGHNRFAEVQTQQSPMPVRASFHRLNESILGNRVDSSGHFDQVLKLHQSFLEKIFPYAKKEIAATKTSVAFRDRDQFLKRAQALIQLHQDLLARKRGFSN